MFRVEKGCIIVSYDDGHGCFNLAIYFPVLNEIKRHLLKNENSFSIKPYFFIKKSMCYEISCEGFSIFLPLYEVRPLIKAIDKILRSRIKLCEV